MDCPGSHLRNSDRSACSGTSSLKAGMPCCQRLPRSSVNMHSEDCPSRVLVINPGSTSTKLAVYDGLLEKLAETIRYESGQLAEYTTMYSQLDFRMADLLEVLKSKGINLETVDFIMARGGALKPLEGGAWEITGHMLDDLRNARHGEHASSLAALIAAEISLNHGIPAAIYDPPATDEMDEVARLAGHPSFHRASRFHALNQKAVARRASTELEKPYNETRLVVAHLGGGISVGVHRDGRVVDVNDALDGSGPLSPERSGTLPAGQLAKLCFSGTVTHAEVKRMMVGQGGLQAYLGTTDVREACDRATAGDARASLVLDAMVYQIAKEIGAAATVLEGKLDGIVLSGSIAMSEYLVGLIRKRIDFLGRVFVYPGEDEMTALRDAAFRLISGEESARPYT